MMELEEFRQEFINEDVYAEAVNTNRYPEVVFIDHCVDILQNDYSLISGMNHTFYTFREGTKQYKNMHLDASYLDLPSGTLDLLIADFNEGDIKTITNGTIDEKTRLMLSFLENTFKGFFTKAEQSDPAVQLAYDIRRNVDSIKKIHLFIVSTDRLSTAVKTLDKVTSFTFGSYTFEVALDVLDMEKIFRSKMAGFQKEDLIINCADFGFEGIPCIKAEIDTDQYDSYLAIVPGTFLAEIYKKHGPTLLESNVRSFLKFNGAVNKGMRATILNPDEKSRFFTYNNGISTTAKSVETVLTQDRGLVITSFTDLQIINGGQTTATLAATNIKNNADLSGIFVQMKLTVLKVEDPDLVRNIATYANSQNKVKTADLNSSHPFYVRMEEFSRKIYAPLASGQLVQQLWFFERARGQYEQPLMQMTKKQRDDYKLVRPKDKKFTLTDLSKYMNAADMLPHYVSWGGEVNSAHFHNNMLKQWNKDNSVFNELFYKELIGKKIFFAFIENVVSDQEWYQERRAYRPQLVAYTYAKLVLEAKKAKKCVNFRGIWDLQTVPQAYYKDVALIAKIVFDTIYDDNRSTANIETYCKKEECWLIVQKKPYELSDGIREVLITPSDREIEEVQARKDQKLTSGLSVEVEIFTKGTSYWESLISRGLERNVLNYVDAQMLGNAVSYCNGRFAQLSKHQVKEITRIVEDLKANGIV